MTLDTVYKWKNVAFPVSYNDTNYGVSFVVSDGGVSRAALGGRYNGSIDVLFESSGSGTTIYNNCVIVIGRKS